MKDVSDNKTLDWVGGMKSSAEIRQALIQIAERKGYPYYSLSVVRDVIFAIRNNMDHHLKAEVEKEKIILCSVGGYKNNRLDTLITFCNRIGMKKILADVSGVSHSNISNITRGNAELTPTLWVRLPDSFNEADRLYSRKEFNRKVRKEHLRLVRVNRNEEK